MARGEQVVVLRRDHDVGAWLVAMDTGLAVSGAAAVAPPAHAQFVEPAGHLCSGRQRHLGSFEQAVHGQAFATFPSRRDPEQGVIKTAAAQQRDLRFIPAGVHGPQPGQLEEQRQALKPLQPAGPLLRALRELRVRTRVHGRKAVAMRAQPTAPAVRSIVHQDIQLVIAAQRLRSPMLYHGADDLQRLADRGAAIDVIPEEERAAGGMAVAAAALPIAEARQQIAERGGFAVDVADEVNGFNVHGDRVARLALGKQGSLRNNVDSMDKFTALFARGGFSLERLRTLCLVGEAGSLTAAAEGDSTRVSLYSRQLRELETFFGTRLAARRGKRMALTNAGQELAALGRRHFIELTDFARQCAGEPLEVTLGAGASVMEWLLTPKLPILRRAMRGSQIKLIRERSEVLASRLREQRLDVAVLREDAVINPLKTEPFAALGYRLFVPRRLAGSPRTLDRWLPKLPMISPASGWTRERVEAAAAAAGVTWRSEIEGASATMAVRALREGHCAAILPDLAIVELAGADVVALRPAFLRAIERRLVIAWHPRQTETRAVTLRAVTALRKLRDR